MLMFVPGLGWFSQRQQCCSARGLSSCTGLHCPGKQRSLLAGHVTHVDLGVWLLPGRCSHADVEPRAATCRWSSSVCFGGLFVVVFFRLGRYWERRNLIPGNLGYWKQVKSSQPHRLCIFFFPSLSKENVIFMVQHTNSLLAKKRHFFPLLPEIGNM